MRPYFVGIFPYTVPETAFDNVCIELVPTINVREVIQKIQGVILIQGT